MDLNSLFYAFKSRCSTINRFIRTKKGKRLFLIACVVFVCLLFCPLFHSAVGAALIGCVAAPMTVMAWRRYDFHHAVVPAVFLCVPMVLSMIIYHNLSVAACLLVSLVSTIAVSIHPVFDFLRTMKDNMYAFLSMGAICVVIVVLASIMILLVTVAWWLFCLFLFFAIIAMFFIVVLSSAAYTATDDKRQERKKQLKKEHLEYDSYDLDVFAKDIGLKNETDPDAEMINRQRRKRLDDEPLFYDIDN